MTAEEVKEKINEDRYNIAFIIGNGINRYKNDSSLSWDKLLIDLWKKFFNDQMKTIPKGISNTEFYDILEFEFFKQPLAERNNKSTVLRNEKEDISSDGKSLDNTPLVGDMQKETARLMRLWKARDHHKKIISKIKELNAPVLTTNYDETLSRSIGLKYYAMEDEDFSSKFPWSAYFSEKEILDDPSAAFGVWHINGQIKYSESIKLGLSQYMESTENARRMLHSSKLDEIQYFMGKDMPIWEGKNTWLHIVFNKSLFVFGLALKEDETFLRWLLIQRAKYFILFPDREKKGWYLKRDADDMSEGQELFLKKVGLKVLSVPTYENIYEDIWQ